MAARRNVDARVTLVAKLWAASLVSSRRSADPLEHLAWVEGGAPFGQAGIERFLDGVPDERDGVTAADVERALALLPLLHDGGLSLGDLYQRTASSRRRHALGEYYTPAWLVELVLDRAGFEPGERLIDPMCGAGAFLQTAIARLRRDRPDIPSSEIAGAIHGMDRNPSAVLMARATYLAALRGCASWPSTIPIRCADAILSPDTLETGARDDGRERFDVVVGNPPWVGWESLDEEYRAATKPLWRRHGLFPDGAAGMKALLGRGRKDLAMLATYAAADRFLRPGGRLAFVIAHSVFKSVGGGAGFRRLVLGDGTPLRVLHVDDLSRRRMFGPVAARAAVMTLRKGEPTRFPVAWSVWRSRSATPESHSAEPVDPADPTSAWLSGTRSQLQRIRCVLGPSWYRARAGAYTGGANGVYWVVPAAGGRGLYRNMAESGKREVPVVETPLEEELVHPLLRASDIGRLEAHGSAMILLPQDPVRRRGIDEETMAARHPAALDYLSRFRSLLAARRDRGTRSLIASGAPFYTIFSVTTDTMAPWKVVWPRIASRVDAAAAGPREGRPVIPQETCSFIACASVDPEREAHFLAGLLCSSLFNDAAAAFTQQGGKSFGAPHLLRHIAVPRFDPERPDHARLADLVRRSGPDLPQTDLDVAADRVWSRNREASGPYRGSARRR